MWMLALPVAAGVSYWWLRHHPITGPALTDPTTVANAQSILAQFATTQGAVYGTPGPGPLAAWTKFFQMYAVAQKPPARIRQDGVLDQPTYTALTSWAQHQAVQAVAASAGSAPTVAMAAPPAAVAAGTAADTSVDAGTAAAVVSAQAKG